MRNWYPRVVAAGVMVAGLMFCALPAWAQAPATVKFEFERAGVDLPHWRITVDAKGDGSYEEFPAGDAAPVKQTVHVGPLNLKKLNAGMVQAATKSCETKLKNIAKTGKKTIIYLSTSGETLGECSYNMADDAGLSDTTKAFLDMQETMRAGQRLAFKHRFDRLGLDAEMDSLVGMVKEGQAIELGNIAPVLESIAGDSQVMQRVRNKAMTLLKQAQVEG